MIRYVFKDEPLRIKGAKHADPQKIGEALAIIAAGAGGDFTPVAVVDAARDPASPLNPHFEWDDSVAAEKFRLDQAREIVRCVRVADIEANGEPARAFVSISDHGTSYRTIQEIKGNAALQTKMLEAAERDLEAFQARYRSLRDVCAIVETAKEAVRARRGKNNETRVAA